VMRWRACLVPCCDAVGRQESSALFIPEREPGRRSIEGNGMGGDG